jgi:hypothetical protein
VPKEEALAQDYLATYGPERSAFVVRHALKAAKAADFGSPGTPVKTEYRLKVSLRFPMV